MKRKIGEQINAVRLCEAAIAGTKSLPKDGSARDYLAECIAGALATLEVIREHEDDVRALIAQKRRGAEK